MTNRVHNPGKEKLTRAAQLMVLSLIAVALVITAACDGTQPAPQPEAALSTVVPEPSPTRPSIDGATWILESIDGEPPTAGTHLTLAVDGPQFSGFDGCNSFGGRHESGKPVIERNGTISLPGIAMTAAGCPTPAILDQAKRYLDAMKREAKARVVDDRLHVLDGSGEVVLVFAREQPLAGKPRDLVGTSWRLLDDDKTYGEGDTTLLFLNSWAATGTTVCRDYTVGYTASEGRIRMPYKGMSGSSEPCSSEVSRQEHQFIEDFGWADEYSINQADGAERLEVRTSRGKTLTFEPLPQSVGDIFEGQWRLVRFLETRSDGSSMRWLTDRDVEPGGNITAKFDEGSIEGSLGCHSYAYRAVGEPGATLVGQDGTISGGDAILSTENSCDDGAGITAQQQRYLDFLTDAERYHVFEDRLVIMTSGGDALVFQLERVSSRARPVDSATTPTYGHA